MFVVLGGAFQKHPFSRAHISVISGQLFTDHVFKEEIKLEASRALEDALRSRDIEEWTILAHRIDSSTHMENRHQ